MFHILLSSLWCDTTSRKQCKLALKRGSVATSVCPTHFSPRSAFPHLNCTLKSLSKAFFVHCMTQGCPLFPCYNCYWLGDEQIGAEAHEQAPQLFPRTVEILPRVFSPKLIRHFPHKVCCQGLWWGKQGEGKNISCSWTYIFYLFHSAFRLSSVHLSVWL